MLHGRDESAFRSLYRRHTPALFALARRLLGDEREAGDVVQDTWVRATSSLPRFAWRSSLRTWLGAILVNVCREQWQARGESLTLPDDVPDAPRDVDLRVDIEQALVSLAPGYRAVVVLHDIEGFTHEEIAERLGIEPGTSKSQLSRARRVLRDRLSHLPEGTPHA